jgi:uncharacterized protein (DUF2141 family)
LGAVALATLALALAATTVAAAEVSVEVRNIESAKGRVLVALCTAQSFLRLHCPYSAAGDATAGATTVVIRSVPAGTYALQAFHDTDGDRAIGRNLLGMPTEGIGFGNDAAMRFGPPTFADAAVTVAEPATSTSLSLRYLSRR